MPRSLLGFLDGQGTPFLELHLVPRPSGWAFWIGRQYENELTL